jgi:hypothetical protein
MLRRALPLLIVLAVAPAAQAGPTAHAAKSCSLSSAEKGGSKPSTLGATYHTSLSARHVSCGKAKKVVKAFHNCRGSATGHCSSVKGYSCSEKRTSSPVQFESSATCKKGSKRVKFHYSQNT